MKKKKTNMRTVIRQIVREEVAMAINEVITELRQPTQQVSQPKQKKQIIEKKTFSKNSVVNDILNETAQSDDWKTMGDGTYDSSRMNEVMSSQYGNLMSNELAPTPGNVNADARVAEMGVNPENVSDTLKDTLFNKDYSGVVKAMQNKANTSRGH